MTATTDLAEIAEIDFSDEAHEAFRAFGAYANYRAIPSVLDGLKPGARRMLWAMRQNGYVPGKRNAKAMSVVGDILKYHPHGDCLAASTRVMALDGTFPTIASLTESGVESLEVLSVGAGGAVVPARAHSFRVGQHAKTTYRVHLSDGTSLTTTGDHQFLLADGSWVRAKDLVDGPALRGAWRGADAVVVDHDLTWVVRVEPSSHGVAVPMYDFTVDGHQNMLVAPDGASLTSPFGVGLVTVHNSSVYGAMVTVAHVPSEGLSVKRLVPLIHGQGGWGDLDFGAAAPRYTECRLNEAAMALLGIDEVVTGGAPEVDENGVDMVENYSGERLEPVVLPALWPAFVVNGNEGIGAGVAMDAAPHALGEVMDLAIALLESPNLRTSTSARILPGPDLPCEADVFDTEDGGIAAYMATGKGSFVMRARYEIETYAGEKKTHGSRIVVTGLPYRISATKVVEGVSGMIEAGELPAGVSVSNYSDAAVRVVIDVASNDAQDVLARLLHFGRKSHLQESFTVSSNAVVDSRIQCVGPVEATRLWVEHRRVVVRRRSRFRLDKALSRLELVQGFLIAIPSAAAIVETIRASADRPAASAAMVTLYGLSERQAGAVLDMSLSRLTRLGTEQYEAERDALNVIVATCTELLGEPKVLDARLRTEFRATKARYQAPRRTRLRLDESAAVARPAAIEVVVASKPGYLVATAGHYVRFTSRRPSASPIVGNDHVVAVDKVSDTDALEVVTSFGAQHRVPMASVPEKMTKVDALLPLAVGEKVVAARCPALAGPSPDLVLVTTAGAIKLVEASTWGDLRAGKTKPVLAAGAGSGCELLAAYFLPPGADIALLSSAGRILRLDAGALTRKGRSAGAIPGIKMAAGVAAIWSGPVAPGDRLAYLTQGEKVAVVDMDSIAPASRATNGSSITRTKSALARAVMLEGETLSWYLPSAEEAASLEVSELAVGADLSDRQLKVVAAGAVLSAHALWSGPAPGA